MTRTLLRWLLAGCLGFAFFAPAALAEPEDGWMVHVNRDRDTGSYRYLVPVPMETLPGAPIELMVFGEAEHSIVSVDGAWPDAVVKGNGTVASVVFHAPTMPGDYRFYCKLHTRPDADPAEAEVGVLRVVGATAEGGVEPMNDSAATGPAAPGRAVGLPGALAFAALFVALLLASRRP